MGEPIKKLGQIVSDIQDTLGQFKDNISLAPETTNINFRIEKDINNDNIKIENDNSLNTNSNKLTEIMETENNIVDYTLKAKTLSENLYEKVNDDISNISYKDGSQLNNVNDSILENIKIKKENNNQNKFSSIEENYVYYEKNENDLDNNIKKNVRNEIPNYSIDIKNIEINSETPNKNMLQKRYTKSHSPSMKLDIPDENTYLLMKDLIEKEKQKSEDIKNLNNIINEYNKKNKIVEEENKNLRQINRAMQFKLDEINANLLNMTSFDNASSIKENDEGYSNVFSPSNQDKFITLINDIISLFSNLLNPKFNKKNSNSYLIKIVLDKLINSFNQCLQSIKIYIKDYSEEKPYSLCKYIITDVCNCFKECHDNINELYSNNENFNDIKIEVDDINVLKEEYKKSLNIINNLDNENNKNLLTIKKLNLQIGNIEKLHNNEKDNNSVKLREITEKYNKLLIENENMKNNQIYLENLIEKWKQENCKLQKAILSFKNEFPADKDLLQKNRILKNKLDDEKLNVKKYNELIKALKTEIDQLKAENIQDNGKLTKQMTSELSNIKDIQTLYLENIKQITDKYNDNETNNNNSSVKFLNKQIEKLFEAIQETDKTKNHLVKLEQTIEEQIKEKDKVIFENKKIKNELFELQEKFKSHEDIWLKKCRDLNNDLNSTKNLLKKTHNDYINKEKEVIECQAIIDDYLLQYSKACDTCIAISSIHKKSTQFLDNLCLRPGLTKQPFPFDEEIKHLCTWIKESENSLLNNELNTNKLNELINNKDHEIEKLKNKSEELKIDIKDLQNLYDESKKKEKEIQELNEKQKEEYEEKLNKSLEQQKVLKKKIEQLFKGCQLFVSGAPASAYSLN